MKDNSSFILGSLKPQFYPAYAQYFVKYLQAYQAQGVPIDYMSVQNEPNCCNGYPSMVWTPDALHDFTVHFLYPALHAAGLTTKVLIHDFNWFDYPKWGAPLMNDPAVRNDRNFGGIAWHGYLGDVTTQSTVHDQYPAADAFDTEHTGGAWANAQQQQSADMIDVIGFTRNWGRSVTKWSLAVDQNHGPFNKVPGASGCDSCNGLITVHNGDERAGEIDYTIEYYDMGQLTKFVRPSAYRIDSTATTTVPNVAWKNPDGSKVVIAYNGTASDQTIHINWGTQSLTYALPASTTGTFTWTGIQQNPLVPDLTGMRSLDTVRQTLQHAGLTLGTTSSVPVNESADGGVIRSQIPIANTWIPSGRPVNITVGIWNGNHL
jgi:glucosylceramidase